jgi:hypothetical protein
MDWTPELIVFLILMLGELLLGGALIIAGIVLVARGKRSKVAEDLSFTKRFRVGQISGGALLVCLGTVIVLWGPKGAAYEDGSLRFAESAAPDLAGDTDTAPAAPLDDFVGPPEPPTVIREGTMAHESAVAIDISEGGEAAEDDSQDHEAVAGSEGPPEDPGAVTGRPDPLPDPSEAHAAE